MPRRGNRKASLASRLANIKPRGIVLPDEIPGSQTWLLKKNLESTRLKYDAKKAQESFFANYSVEELAAYAKLIPRTISTTLSVSSGFIPENGSSSSSAFGSAAMAIAMPSSRK